MHLSEIDVGRMVKAFILSCFCLLMIVPSISLRAQQATPTPAPGDVAGQVASAVERVGGTNNAIQLLIIILLLVFAWRIVVPLIQANTTAYQQIATMNAQTVTSQAEISRTMERTGIVLTNLETKQEAEDGRDGAVETINKHTDERLDATDKKIDGLDGKIDGVISTLEEARKEAITQEKFDKTINPFVLKLDEALTEMRAMKTSSTGEHPAVISAPISSVNGDSAPVPTSEGT